VLKDSTVCQQFRLR